MGVHHIISQLAENGIQLYLDSGVLKSRAHKGAMNTVWIATIKDNKAALIDFLSKGTNDTTDNNIIDKATREGPIPLSFAQQRLWLVSQMEAQSTHYNMPMALRVEGAFCQVAAERALLKIVERHEVLRTVYKLHGSEVEQVINKVPDSLLQVIDFSAHKDFEQPLRQIVFEDTHKPFDLSQDLMLRSSYIKLSDIAGVLLLNMHHIASDGWSMGVLIREFMHLYQCYVEGRPDALQPLSIQYADYAIWQKGAIGGVGLEKQLDYWRQHLEGAPVVHSLPLDFEHSSQALHQGERMVSKLDAEVAQALIALAKAQGVTPFMVLHAALSLLLSRHSSNTDIIIGTPVANRQNEALYPLLGCFVNTLVLRSNTANHETFSSYLEHIKTLNLQAQVNQDVPFEQLVEALNIVRHSQINPLVQFMFSMDTNEQVPLALEGIKFSAFDNQGLTAKFELNLAGAVSDKGITLDWIYDKALFKSTTVARLSTHLQNIIRAVVDNPYVKLSDIDMLGLVEAQQLLNAASHQSSYQLKQVTVAERFSEQAKLHPYKTALVYDDQSMSYQQLEQQSNRLAHYLIRQNIGLETAVGIAFHRSFDMVVAILAILKSGGLYVPLDPGYPKSRLEHMIADSGIKMLLTQSDLVGRFTAEQVSIVAVDQLTEQLAACNDTLPELCTHPVSNLAYINYTSGSSGLPKGVMVPHQAVIRLVVNTDFMPLDDNSRFLQASSISFDAATLELWGPLLNGGCCVLYHETLMDLSSLNQIIFKHQVNCMWLTAGLFEQWSQDIHRSTEQLGSLRYLLAGGDVINPLAVSTVQHYLPEVILINGYGPTENTTFSCCYRIPGMFDSQASGSIPIGKAIKGSSAYVLDEHQAMTPQGCVGELYVGGYGLARGYLNQDELTAKHFITSPFDSDAYLYKTGDLVRLLPDGNLEFIGRKDQQVKIRGFRIELSEIEVQIGRLSQIQSVVLTIQGEDINNKQLVAYVQGAEGITDLTRTMRAELSGQLPDYMIPSVFVTVDEWPLTNNGKIDRRALPKPDLNGLHGTYVAPKAGVEQTLASIWSGLLKCEADKVSATADFFEMGGHSLLAVRLVSEVRNRFGVDWSVKDVFTATSIRGQARLIDNADSTLQTRIVPVDHSFQLPLSFAQQRLWFISQMEDGRNSQYNIPFALKIKGLFDANIAEQALLRIIQRHSVLRSVYVKLDEKHSVENADAAVQIIREKVDWAMTKVDLSRLLVAEREREIARLMNQDKNASFDLTKDIMLRASWIQVGNNEGVLLLNLHHIAADGWSLGVLVKEFTGLYQSLCNDQPDPFTNLAIQYADFACWQRNALTGDAFDAQLNYWARNLEDAPVIHSLPLDFKRPVQLSYDGQIVKGQLALIHVEQLQLIARKAGVTPFMLMHAAFSLVLSRHSNTNDIVIGTPVANRTQAALEPLIGCFVNTLVLRSDCGQSSTFIEYLDYIKQVNLGAQDHQDIQFEQLVNKLKVPRNIQHSPLFQIMLSMNTNEDAHLHLEGIEFSALKSSDITAKYELQLDVELHGGQYFFSWIYNKHLFNSATVERMNRHLNTLLSAIAECPEQPLASLPMMAKDEVEQVFAQAKGPQIDFPKSQLWHELLSIQAQKTPHRTALFSHEGVISYQELDIRSNQLAHYLREQGVTTDTLVGIMTKRSIDTVVAILSVLKAGGAYVPLDPEYPEQRLLYIIEDSGTDILLTQSEFLHRFSTQVSHCIAMDALGPKLQDYSVSVPDRLEQTSASLAYVIYTSGSTGQPKGVLIEHHSLVNLTYRIHELQLGVSDKPWGWCASYAFDSSVKGLTQLMLGQPLSIISHQDKLQIRLLQKRIEHERISVIDCTPSLLETWLSQGAAAFLPDLIIGGEAISTGLWQSLVELQKKSGVRVYNVYGPTECTVNSSWTQVAGDTPNIGSSIGNTESFVMSCSQQLVPVGCVGELYIGGEGLARGYLGSEQKTQQSFVSVDFADAGLVARAKRLYRTGDMVRQMADGRLEYIGRFDNQIKFNGYRLEPGEIEATLLHCNHVSGATVMVDDRDGRHILICYVIFDHSVDDMQSDKELFDALKLQLKSFLPAYMVPGVFVRMDNWPLTNNGKIDRKKLPKPDMTQLTGSYVAAVSENEKTMAGIWQKVLGVARVGMLDNFFDLGGHSLLAVVLTTTIAQEMNANVPLKALFTYPTLQALVCYIESDVAQCGDQGQFGLITVSALGRGEKVFVVPALGLMALAYQPLAQAMQGHINLSILTTPGIDELVATDSKSLKASMSQRVEQWYQAIKSEQSDGHYRLVGHSFGGAIVFELAKRLEAEGKNVSVVLVDSYLAAASELGSCRSLPEILLGPSTELVNNQQLRERLIAMGLMPADISKTQFDAYCLAANQQIELNANYSPALKVSGQVYLVLAAQGLDQFSGRDRVIEHIQSWCCRPLIQQIVQGNHLSVIKSIELARQLENWLVSK